MLQGQTEGHRQCTHVSRAAQKQGTSDLQVLVLSVSAGGFFLFVGLVLFEVLFVYLFGFLPKASSASCLFFLVAGAARKGDIHEAFFLLAALVAEVDSGEVGSWDHSVARLHTKLWAALLSTSILFMLCR